ncbi:MAG TPA: type II toxin-antitoxin system HicA family toxin [Thermoanaerobaculia bacterium]|nr:type II toxin-antitoxin system HicA family toxin [Thermoanaerobaculia bacterium]
MPKLLRCREMLKRLRAHDKRFSVSVERGKGSHRMVVLTTKDGESHYPFPCHNDGAEIDRRYLRDIINYFGLPPDIFD